jgi:hypothetical protein
MYTCFYVGTILNCINRHLKKTPFKKKLNVICIYSVGYIQIYPVLISNSTIQNMSPFSIFIPRVFSNISVERICDIFSSKNIGDVDTVNLVRRVNKKGEQYNMAFVHFRRLYDNEQSRGFRTSVENPDECNEFRFYYGPTIWYWKIFLYKKNTSVHEPQQVNAGRTRVGSPAGSSLNPQAPVYMPVQHQFPSGYGNMGHFGSVSYPTQLHHTQMVPSQVNYGNYLEHNRPPHRSRPRPRRHKKGAVVNREIHPTQESGELQDGAK